MRMENESLQQNIKVILPLSVKYAAIDKLLREKLTGEIIKKEDKAGEGSNYAQILDVTLEKSHKNNFDVQLNIKFQFLTTFFKNREADAEIHAVIQLDPSKQRLFIKDYSVVSDTNNWLADKLLQGVVNTWMYKRIKSKMTFDLDSFLSKNLDSINKQLENKLEVKTGTYVLGNLESIKLVEILAAETHLQLALNIKGHSEIEIDEINF
ncbi:hypothetical protein LPB144_11710 [Christiangramia salexigens]|uniref:DUF4403 domain-containing protein n=2 Tax=Christiangramia salexigens TaxID=1913577 RepID=A0A1L3J7D6_9FLAO|nr:hypothetical protein LPB144_11710 [Christiangramia salexigens]